MQLLRRWWFHLIGGGKKKKKGGGVGFRRKAIHGSSVVVKLIISYGQEDALQAAGNVIGVEKGRAHGI